MIPKCLKSARLSQDLMASFILCDTALHAVDDV